MSSYIHTFVNGSDKIYFNSFSLKWICRTSGNNENISSEFYLKKSIRYTETDSAIDQIQIAVTTKCNLRCIYCQLYQNRPKSIENMSMATAHWILERHKDIFQAGTIILTGGEPLLNWEVASLFLSKANGRKIIFTNALLLDEAKIEFCKANNVFIIVSSDGDLDCNNYSRKSVKGTNVADIIHSKIKLLKYKGVAFGISLVLNNGNYYQLNSICEWLLEEYSPMSLGINLPHYTIDYNWSYDENTLIAEFLKVLHTSIERNIFIDPIARYISPVVHQEFKLHDCSSCGRKLVYYPNGKESNCILQHIFTKGNKTDIWKNRSTLHSEECEACYAVGICGGGCTFDGNRLYGEGKFDKRRCGIVKAVVKEFLFIAAQAHPENKSEDLITHYSSLINNPTNSCWSVGHD